MSADRPGAEERGGPQCPVLDHCGQFSRGSTAARPAGAGPVEGLWIHIYTVYIYTKGNQRYTFIFRIWSSVLT